MDDLDLAYALKPRKADDKEPSVTMTTGTATEDSKDGFVKVNIGGHVVGDTQALVMATTVAVKAGDTVRVELYGTTGKTPTVTGVVGGGDKQQAEIDKAQQTAQQAQTDAAQAQQQVTQVSTIANEAKELIMAQKQHVWSDDNGVHVSTEADNAAGKSNVVLNSQGFSVRSGHSNLVTTTQSGFAIYDGDGNDAQNITAAFSKDKVSIGKEPQKEDAASSIELLGGSARIDASYVYAGGARDKTDVNISADGRLSITSRAKNVVLEARNRVIALTNFFQYKGSEVATKADLASITQPRPSKLFTGDYAATKSNPIVLSDVVTNYDRIDVIYQTSGKDVGTITLYSPAAAMRFNAFSVEATKDHVYMKMKTWQIGNDLKTIATAKSFDGGAYQRQEYHFPYTDNTGIYFSYVDSIGIIAVYGYKF